MMMDATTSRLELRMVSPPSNPGSIPQTSNGEVIGLEEEINDRDDEDE